MSPILSAGETHGTTMLVAPESISILTEGPIGQGWFKAFRTCRVTPHWLVSSHGKISPLLCTQSATIHLVENPDTKSCVGFDSVPIGDDLAGVNRARNGDIYHMGQDGQIREGNTPPSKHWSWLINVPCTELEANFNPECAIRHFHACCRCLPSLHRLTAWGLGCSFQGRSVYGTSSGLKLTSSIPSALLRAQR